MHELGLRPNRPFRKCARVVGEVLGKYHPHGDQAVYDALVRMVRPHHRLRRVCTLSAPMVGLTLAAVVAQAQDFVMAEPLVAGHGNFGSLDADPPAAMRYTECKLQPLADAMLLSDLSEATVGYAASFDGSENEPVVLPARLPNLLLNGSSGIAVGMATSIPPHNLSELADAVELIARNPDASLADILRCMPAPDFPTGGIIMVGDSLRAAYATGNGGAVLRGRAVIETLPGKQPREAVVITEIPYNGNKATLVTRLAELVNERVIEGVADIRDESDRDGMRVVLELRRGVDAAGVMDAVFKHTKMSVRVSLNMVAIVDGAPMTVGLVDMLKHFVNFRCEVIRKRASAQLATAIERAHIVAGLRTAMEKMDATVDAIRKAKDSASAAQALHSVIGLTEAQSAAVLAMPLRRLTTLETGNLAKEDAQLKATIKDLQGLLDSEKRVIDVLVSEALELKQKFGRPRRTDVQADVVTSSPTKDVLALSDGAGVADVECLITVSERGYIKRMRPVAFSGPTGKAPMRPNRPKVAANLRADDTLMRIVSCRDKDTVLLFTQKARAFALPAHTVPESNRTTVGTPLPQLLPFAPGEMATAAIAVSDFNHSLVMLTQKGWLKRMPLSELDSLRRRNAGLNALKLEPGDSLQFVRLCSEGDELLIGSSDGHMIRFPINDEQLRSTARGSRGVIAMDLHADAQCVSMDVIPQGVLPTTVPPGFESGVESGDETDGEGDGEKTKGRMSGAQPPYALLVTQQGYAKRVPVAAFRQVTRRKKGVIAVRLTPGDTLTSIRVVGLPPATEQPAQKRRTARTRPRRGSGEESDVSDGEDAENGQAVSSGSVGEEEEEEVVVATVDGKISRCRVSEVRITKRTARGVKLVRLEGEDRVRAVTLLPRSQDTSSEDPGDRYGR